MRTIYFRLLVATVLWYYLWPSVALAESPKAGVVTTLQGQATVARAVMLEPVPLRFKDDVFIRDRIDTRENSVVRVLLGGKALVTVRELSTFTITDEPGRAIVDLKVGKLTLGLAKHLLNPDEAIEVRTPNAIVAVRGSMVVVEVRTMGGVPRTDVFVLEASRPVMVSSRDNPALAIPLLPKGAVNVYGDGTAARIGPVEKMTPAQLGEIQTTAGAPRPREQSETAPPQLIAKVNSAQLEAASQIAAQLQEGKGDLPPGLSALKGNGLLKPGAELGIGLPQTGVLTSTVSASITSTTTLSTSGISTSDLSSALTTKTLEKLLRK